MTSATERLRALLDERGVMHGYVEPDCVWWEGEGNGVAYEAIEVYVLDEPSGYFAVRDLTPEQAIDATLGPGTCKYVGEDADNIAGIVFRCSKCGNVEWPRPRNFCPNCGRRVIG